MIRFFATLCKTLLKENWSDEQLYYEAVNAFSQYDAVCPECGASGQLAAHGDYCRNLVSYEDDKPIERRISPPRLMCASCETTHALLPGIITPYSPYSLSFKLKAVRKYYEKDKTVSDVCKYFCIAVSTLYAWINLLGEHKDLQLGRLASRAKPAPVFLDDLFECRRLSDLLGGFFMRHAISFMQNSPGPKAGATPAAARSPPP